MAGTVVFEMFAGFYFWWPKMFGYKLSEGLGKLHFWLLTLGFHMTFFLIQHWLGVDGAPRRYVNYLHEDGFDWMNEIFNRSRARSSWVPRPCRSCSTWC